jgi:hypothetical protein
MGITYLRSLACICGSKFLLVSPPIEGHRYIFDILVLFSEWCFPLYQSRGSIQKKLSKNNSRVEEGRGVVCTIRFPSPLIKPDVRISRIRLSDWLHRKHSAGSDMSVFPVLTRPWRYDRVCSDGSRFQTVLVRLSPIHQPSPSSTNAPEVRALSSAGVTRLRRYYDPVRLPRRPMPFGTVEAATLVMHGSLPLAHYPVSTCCALLPRWTEQVHLSAASLFVLPSP